MQLNEKVFSYSIDKQTSGLREGVLAKVKYILNDIDKPNYNKRVYERATIDRAISDPEIIEKLQNRNLWVGPEHPEKSMLPATDIAGILTEMYVDEGKNQLIGVVEILGTPAGKIIEAILKGGGGIGVSTRAEGELCESEMEFEGKKGKYFKVVKESYKLNGLDFTSEPSCFSSKPIGICILTAFFVRRSKIVAYECSKDAPVRSSLFIKQTRGTLASSA